MTNIGVLLAFGGLSALSFFDCRNSTIGMISKIGINKRYYPQKYIALSPRLAKTFGIKQEKIPKYLRFELYMAIVFAAMFPISVLAYLCFRNVEVVCIMVLTHAVLIIANAMYFCVNSLIWQRQH